MTIKGGEILLKPFIKRAEKEGDPYVLVHFSREQDKYEGYHEGLDKMDAMIVIKHLVKAYNIDAILLQTALPPAEAQ